MNLILLERIKQIFWAVFAWMLCGEITILIVYNGMQQFSLSTVILFGLIAGPTNIFIETYIIKRLVEKLPLYQLISIKIIGYILSLF